jgi:superfamily I DNA and/or RNA helicase
MKVCLNEHREYFLDRDVDVIFVTCSSASNDALQTFKAEVATVDEAGQATLADICMATAPFKETILSLSPTGDHVQLGPVVIANKENEALRLLQTSHFENHIKSGGEEWPHHIVQEHYRSHPDITAFPNEFLYRGELINNASTSVLTGTQETLKQFLAPLGTAWNKKWRLRVDVSGVSELYGNTHSACNQKEADFIVDFVVKMVNFVPKEEGIFPKPERIVLKDIGIQSPYKGQVWIIDRKLH